MSGFSGKRRSFLLASTLGAVSLALAGCDSASKAEFIGSDITGTRLGVDLALQDSAGKTRRLEDYKGKVALMFFGFTHCPDVCPTAMAELAQTMEILGKDASQVQVVMITVDPERDTPEILAQYVQAFNPTFTGLWGTPEQLSATAKSFKAFYAKSPGATPDAYSMDHASSFYIFDKKGEVRVLARGDASAQDIASDIRQLL
jgi:protein SCO1/2